MAINLDELRNGLEAMSGTFADASNVSNRVLNEIQKMITSAQLLLQKQNLTKAAFDNWSAIIKTLSDRHTYFHKVIMDHPVGHTDDVFPAWTELKTLANDVARSSNQLSGELADSGSMIKYIAIGAGALLGITLLMHEQPRKTGY